MPALIKTPSALLARFRTQLDEHADDPIAGSCPLCCRTECRPYREARSELAMAGELDWDPLRERNRQRLWLATLDDYWN